MKLSYKWLTVLLCAIAFNFLVVLKTTNVFAQVEANQSPCPSTLLWAVLEKDVAMVEVLLEYSADPNASLENCQELEIEEFRRLDWFPEGSSLLHIAAHTFSGHHDIDSGRIYDLLVSHGANENTMDAREDTPESILREIWRNRRYARVF